MGEIAVKSKKVLALILAIIMLGVGVLSGYLIWGNQKVDISENPDVKVAIVNKDVGTSSGANYGAQITSLLDKKNYEIVNYETGKSGLKDKTYGGMVIVPSDFSEKVSAISSSDLDKVKLDYLVGDELTKKEYVNTYHKIYEVELLFNNKLTSAFVSSVFDDVRDAQGNVTAVNDLNKVTLGAVTSLSMANFVEPINWSTIPEVSINLEKLNLEDYKLVNSDASFANDVKSLYSDAYSKVYEKNTVDINRAIELIDSDYRNMHSYFADMNADKMTLNSYKDRLNAHKLSLTNKTNNFLQDMPQVAVASPEEITRLNDFSVAQYNGASSEISVPRDITAQLNDESTYATVEDYHNAVKAYAEDVIKVGREVREYKDKLATLKNDIDTFRSKLEENRLALSEFVSEYTRKAGEFNRHKATLDSYKSDLERYTGNYKNLLQSESVSDLTPLNSDEKDYREFGEKINANKLNFAEVVKSISPDSVNVTVVDINSAIGVTLADLLENKIADFNSELRAMNNKVNALQDNNANQINNAYTTYNEHINKIHSEAVNGFNAASSKLAEAVEKLNGTANANSQAITGYLKAISGALHYGETGNSTNNSVVSFIAQPVILNDISK